MFDFTHISANIQRTLHNRIKALNREEEYSPLEPRNLDSSASMDEMFTKSVWARVTSAIPAKDEKGNAIKDFFRISSAFKDEKAGTRAIDPINKPITSKESLFTSDPNAVFRPHSGITSITTTYKSHTLQSATINWKFWDIRQFEDYERALLKTGRVVLVEFGWAKNNMISHTGDPSDKPPVVTSQEDMNQIYKATNERIKMAGGDYYCLMGKIVNFDYSVNENGGFDCTTTISGVGHDLFKQPVNPSPETEIPDPAKSKEDKLEEAWANANTGFEDLMKGFDDKLRDDYADGVKNVYHDGEKGWCNWAYFEDIILSSCFGWTVESGEAVPTEGSEDYGNKSKQLTSILSKDVMFEMDPTTNKVIKIKAEALTCRNSENLFTSSIDIILPGKTAGIGGNIKSDGKKLSGDIGELMNEQFKGTETLKDYVKLFHILKEINDKLPQFEKKGDNTKGILRNIVFSSDYLKAHFSGGLTNVESGLNSFWSSVCAQYSNYWDIQFRLSTNNNGQLTLADINAPLIRVKDVNPHGPNDAGKSELGSEKDKAFVFQTYGKNSLMKSFSINVKLSSEQATMTMFHSNKNASSKGTGNLGNDDPGVKAFAELQNVTITPVPDSKVNKTNVEAEVQTIGGSLSTPILDGNLNAYNSPGNQDSGTKQVPIPKGEKVPKYANPDLVKDLESEKLSEEGAMKFDEAYNWFDTNNAKNAGLIYNPDGTMIPSYEKTMIYFLTYTPETTTEYDPLCPLGCEFSIPGIGGIDLYNLFTVDYLPKRYLTYGMFQVKSQDHQVDASGWTTTISGQMRLDVDSMRAAGTVKPVEDKVKVRVSDAEAAGGINFIDFTIASRESEGETE
jgi:hypothetical protein